MFGYATDGQNNHNNVTGAIRSAGNDETRPKNVAVMYCQYTRVGGSGGTGGGVMHLASLTDVNVRGATLGNVLAYNGSTTRLYNRNDST